MRGPRAKKRQLAQFISEFLISYLNVLWLKRAYLEQIRFYAFNEIDRVVNLAYNDKG
jgi:hypothetical protein